MQIMETPVERSLQEVNPIFIVFQIIDPPSKTNKNDKDLTF
jgi:hypothetical protein